MTHITRSTLTLVALLGTATLAGCSGDVSNGAGEDAAEDELNGATTILEAKLRADAHAVVDASCDVHTKARLVRTSRGKLRLSLADAVDGDCEVVVAKDARSYAVTTSHSCGSTVYRGATAADTVELQDNRGRLCEDLRPAALELREYRKGVASERFGASLPLVPPQVATSNLVDVKLYETPLATLDPSCDKYTRLTLQRHGDAIVGKLESLLASGSTCEVLVPRNERTFSLTQVTDSCGSTTYRGAMETDPVLIRDHSARRCAGTLMAKVVVEMTHGQIVTTLYSAH